MTALANPWTETVQGSGVHCSPASPPWWCSWAWTVADSARQSAIAIRMGAMVFAHRPLRRGPRFQASVPAPGINREGTRGRGRTRTPSESRRRLVGGGPVRLGARVIGAPGRGTGFRRVGRFAAFRTEHRHRAEEHRGDEECNEDGTGLLGDRHGGLLGVRTWWKPH